MREKGHLVFANQWYTGHNKVGQTEDLYMDISQLNTMWLKETHFGARKRIT